MARIGIITCSNMTGDLACTSFKCLEDSYAGKGTFAQYEDRGGAQIVGIIGCSGCPTLLAPEKIVRRIRTLVETGVDAIHLANCIEKLCPFRKRYLDVLSAEFPDTEFIVGTHEPMSTEVEQDVAAFVKSALCQHPSSMADLLATRKRHGAEKA